LGTDQYSSSGVEESARNDNTCLQFDTVLKKIAAISKQQNFNKQPVPALQQGDQDQQALE